MVPTMTALRGTSIRSFLMGSWVVARSVHFTRGGFSGGPCSFYGTATFTPSLYYTESADEAIARSRCSPLRCSETGRNKYTCVRDSPRKTHESLYSTERVHNCCIYFAISAALACWHCDHEPLYNIQGTSHLRLAPISPPAKSTYISARNGKQRSYF